MENTTMARDLDALKEQFQSGDYINLPLKNVLLHWAKLDKPDTQFDSVGKYKVNAVLPEQVAEDMKYCGCNIKKMETGDMFIQPTRKPSLGKPIVVDEDGNDVDASTIGNGTLATIEGSLKGCKVAGKTHVPYYISKVIIHDLVIYEPKGKTVDMFE